MFVGTAIPAYALLRPGPSGLLTPGFFSINGNTVYMANSSYVFGDSTNPILNGNFTSLTVGSLTFTSVATGLPIRTLIATDSTGAAVATTTPTFGNFHATSTVATSTIAGGLNVESGGFVYDFTSNNVGIGSSSPAQLLSVEGSASPQIHVKDNTSQAGALTMLTFEVAGSTGTGRGPEILFLGPDGTGSHNVASIRALSENAATAGNFQFLTANSANTLVEALRINATQRVGIGTSTPSARFSVAGGDIFFSGGTFTYASSSTSTVPTAINAWSLTDISTGAPLFSVDTSNRRVGVGSSSPLAKFSIHAQAINSNVNLLTIASSTASATTTLFTVQNTGAIQATALTGATGGTNNDLCINSSTGNFVNETTGTCVVSSRRFKNTIESLTVPALDLIKKLNPVSFSPNDDDSSDHENKQYGLIAEEVAEVDSHLAKYGIDGLPRTLDDRALLSVVIKAMQEQQKQIEQLQEQLKNR